MVQAAPPTFGGRLGAVVRSVLQPLLGSSGGFFLVGAPWVGAVAAVGVVVGLGAWAWWTVRDGGRTDRSGVVALAAAWLVVGAGIAQTDAAASQRFAAMAPLWALAAGTGLTVAAVALARAVVPRRAGSVAAVLLVVAVAVAGAVHARWWFDEDRQLSTYGDTSTTGAYDLGWRLGPIDAPPPLFVWGSARLSYRGFGNARFLAPRLEAATVEQFELPSDLGGDPAAPPTEKVRPDAVVVVPGGWGPEVACRAAVRLADRAVLEAVDRRGHALYWAFPPPRTGLPGGASPAGTVLRPAELGCGSS